MSCRFALFFFRTADEDPEVAEAVHEEASTQKSSAKAKKRAKKRKGGAVAMEVAVMREQTKGKEAELSAKRDLKLTKMKMKAAAKKEKQQTKRLQAVLQVFENVARTDADSGLSPAAALEHLERIVRAANPAVAAASGALEPESAGGDAGESDGEEDDDVDQPEPSDSDGDD